MREILPKDLDKNVFNLIGNEWMLVAAQNEEGKVNAMTASWGGLGVMWGKNVCYVVIRPQRYTKEFVDNSEGFSLTFYEEDKKEMLGYMGRVSGRDEDKIKNAGLTTIVEEGIPYFEEAKITLLCKKLFKQRLSENAVLDKEILDKWYPNEDMHYLYIAEIEKVLVK